MWVRDLRPTGRAGLTRRDGIDTRMDGWQSCCPNLSWRLVTLRPHRLAFLLAMVFASWHTTARASAVTSADLGLGRPVVASSLSSRFPGRGAVDGSRSTRSSIAFSGPQWVFVDLG